MTLKGSILSGGTGTRERVRNDFYATPFDATEDILNKVHLNGTILEPSCGQGHISKVLIDRYGRDKVTSHDIEQYEDKFHCNIEGGHDFLQETEHYDNIITNPPFSLAKEFILKALELSNDKVLIFCKLQLLEGKDRKSMFEHTPLKTVYVFSRRVATLNNGKETDENGKRWATTMATAWFLWEKGYEGKPTIEWL